MHFEMEELVPIVARLTEQYTSFDSTSISYEKAEQLMEAVLYSIQEIELFLQSTFIQEENIKIRQICTGDASVSAQEAYKTGALLVQEKVKRTLDVYNKMRPELVCYGNPFLQDIFEKGLPRFFIWYDARFEPQNTILTLDYPVLRDLSNYTGIDRIYEFIACVQLEQIFLKMFPDSFCMAAVLQENPILPDKSDNLCEAVFTAAIGHILVGKPMTGCSFQKEDYKRIREAVLQSDAGDGKCLPREVGEAFLERYCGEQKELYEYLLGALEGISVRMMNAVKHGALDTLI